MRWRMLLILVLLLPGCTRAFWRRQADRDTYQAIEERDHAPGWDLPNVLINPPPQSRLHDPYNPDRPPLPPDDPAASRYMRCANGMPGYRHWHKNGDAPWIEDPDWRNYLSLDKDGVLILTPERSVELGLLHSRQYYNQLDSLYLTSLALTLNRFEFALHWFATNDTNFTHFGSGADEQNTLTTNSLFGFTKALAAGGQLTAEFANSFIFQFAGPDTTIGASNLIFTLMQPLLRGFGRDVRMEGLTEAERNLLYSVRDFARFRKQFTYNIATGPGGYLSLLFQEQNVRNQIANVASLEQNYRLHEALYISGDVSAVKVDQVFLSLKQGQLSLIQAQAGLEASEDSFKIILGLPPGLPVKLDDSLLAPFQLNGPGLTTLQAEMDKFLPEYRELDVAPSLAKLEDGYKRLRSYHQRLNKLIDQVQDELARWEKQIPQASEDEERSARQRQAHKARVEEVERLRADQKKLADAIARDAAALAENQRKAGWESLERRTTEEISNAAQLYVTQAGVRVYLIRLTPVGYTLEQAVDHALVNRLDLMNQRGRVVDAWRQVDVTASFLKAGFDVTANANIGTKPGGDHPLDFRSSASSYSIGFHFDGPLNREAERNTYRASQITYEQARRSYMALEDQIVRTIRSDLRDLNTEKVSFDIARESLISAARQYLAARADLLTAGAGADPTSTQNILLALNAVLTANNTLIGSWVSYEQTRIQLLLDMEVLQVDERGLYRDGNDNPADNVPGNALGGNDPADNVPANTTAAGPEAAPGP